MRSPGTASGGIAGPIPTWTREGITVDALRFFVAVQDGKPIAPARDKEKPMIFRAGMQAHEIVSLFENLYTQDGSTFKLDRLARTPSWMPRVSASSSRGCARATMCACRGRLGGGARQAPHRHRVSARACISSQ